MKTRTLKLTKVQLETLDHALDVCESDYANAEICGVLPDYAKKMLRKLKSLRKAVLK